MSSSTNSKVLSIEYDANQGLVDYIVLSGGIEQHFSAMAKALGGIRSLEVSEEFDRFLRSISPENPGVVKLIVEKTWAVIDEGGPIAPFFLIDFPS